MKFNHSEFNEEMEERPDMRFDFYLNEEIRERVDEIINLSHLLVPSELPFGFVWELHRYRNRMLVLYWEKLPVLLV